ncbi:MAG: hypothetical protein VCD66_16450 [Alphaproteobacteria bacterium]
MTIYRYAARDGIIDRGALFQSVQAGLLGLWVLIAVAIACSPTLALVGGMDQTARSVVSCEPAGPALPGGLLRCTVEPAASVRDI